MIISTQYNFDYHELSIYKIWIFMSNGHLQFYSVANRSPFLLMNWCFLNKEKQFVL